MKNQRNLPKKRKKRQEGGEKKERKRERRKRKERKEESEGHYSVEEPATPIEEKSPQRSQPARPSSIEDEGLDQQGLKPAPKPVASHPVFPRLLPPPPPPRRPRSPSHPPPDRKGGRGGQGAYWQGRPRSRSPAKRPRGSKEPNTAREGSIVKQVDTTRSNGAQSQAKSKRPCQASSQPSSTQEGGGTSASLPSTRSSPSRRGSSWASGAMVERGRGALDACPRGGVRKGDERRVPRDHLLYGPGQPGRSDQRGHDRKRRRSPSRQPTPTTSEALLRFYSGRPDIVLHCHRCTEECTGEVVADDLVHVQKARLMKGQSEEEPWVRNLLKADPNEEDELRDLRARDALRLSADVEVAKGKKPDEPEKDAGSKKKDKKKSKGKKKKKKKAKKSSSASAKSSKKARKSKAEVQQKKEVSVSSSSSSVGDDGKRPRSASQKSLLSLYRGTGLDPRERVRKRVARRARKRAKHAKADRSSSSSRSGSEGETSIEEDPEDVELFEADSRLKKLSDAFPGALCCLSVKMMRQNLLQSIGEDARPAGVQPVCLSYYRQQLQKRAMGPTQRELVTLSAALDWLLKGHPARAADLMRQRLKSIESVLSGAHWSVAQRMEIAPQEGLFLAAAQELPAAQKDAYSESKVRHLAGLPDGRKGKGKSKEKERERYDHPKGKGKSKGSGKADRTKAKEDTTK